MMPETKLNGKKALIVIPHTQFRDEEFFETKKVLDAAGVAVTVASTSVRACYGMNGGSVDAQLAIADAKADQFDALIICGGSSVPAFLWNDKKLHELASAMAAANKVIAAICLATVVLAKAKLLADREATVYYLPQAIQELKTAGAKYVQKPLIVHDKLILAEGPPESAQFGQAICAALA
jgi:protease I